MTEEVSIFDQVRNSCANYVKQKSNLVTIQEDKIAQFLDAKVIQKLQENPDFLKGFTDPTPIPIKFNNMDHEINFWCLYSLLQFGSGYRKLLHEHCSRGASETITYGLMSMVLSDSKLNTETMVQFTIFDVEQFFQIPIQSEQEHPKNPLIRIGVDSELKPLAAGICHAFNECGNILMAHMHKDFASFIKETLQEQATANHLVKELAKTFPLFDDKYVTKTEQVYFYKKAQLVAGELYKNLKSKNKLFNFPDVKQMTVFVDNVIPATLAKDGIIVYNEELAQQIANAQDIPYGEVDSAIRAAAIVVCDKLVQQSNGLLQALELDYLLWASLGKEPEYRKYERHYTKNTLFY